MTRGVALGGEEVDGSVWFNPVRPLVETIVTVVFIHIFIMFVWGGEHAHVYYVHAPICNIHV